MRLMSRDGIALEAALDEPDEPASGLVLCHPHPKMGGTMNAPLLLTLRDELNKRKWAVLRFNFRGVGGSDGEPGTGIDEVADAQGAIDFLCGRLPGRPIAIAGWSFGAAVAVRAAAEDPGLAACVAIAPSVTPKEGITAGLPDPSDLAIDVPLLVVCGANDELVSPGECRIWTSNLGGTTYAEVPAANHFFWAKYDELARIVADYLDKTVKGAT